MNNGSKEYLITWFIENYSYCWHKNGEKLLSPEIILDCLEGTSWAIQLYPRGHKDESKGNISIFLNRRKDDAGPEKLALNFEISFLATDGSALISAEFAFTFTKRTGFGRSWFMPIDELLIQRKNEYLPQDTLTVRCRMWKGKEHFQPPDQIYARTRIGFEKFSFLHAIENFSSFEPNQKKTIQLRCHSKERLAFTNSIYFLEDLYCEEKILLEITPFCTNQILSQLKLHLINTSGNMIGCGEANKRIDSTGLDIKKIPLSLTRQYIMNRKSEFLPSDKLLLRCECTFSTGVEHHKVETTACETPVVSLGQMKSEDQNTNIYNFSRKLSACSNAIVDFGAIYNDQFLTDVELKTQTKSFKAHKIVLCARSSVFKLMMSNDMKEKNSSSIQIDDLEADIVQQLLLFLYSDKLEKLNWESAMKLYYAGDKYQIEKLKLQCASFLVDNLDPSSVGELLLLADTHNDSDLKKVVIDFILNHKKQVFSSTEWMDLIETNPLLTSKIMCMEYISKFV